MKNKLFTIFFLAAVLSGSIYGQFLGGNGSGYSSVTYSEGPLPVELISFSAVVQNEGILLKWNTASEIDNYGFEIERKNLDYKNKWELLDLVPGNGTSNTENKYSFYDGNLNSGNYSYRLKQIDNDGKFEYSNEVLVVVGIPSSTKLEQNYPNPFNPATTISFKLSKPSFVKLAVYNIIGEEVSLLINEFKEAGIFNVNFDASKLNSGIYLYKLEADGIIKVNKMQLIK
jgi:hypothetical protein